MARLLAIAAILALSLDCGAVVQGVSARTSQKASGPTSESAAFISRGGSPNFRKFELPAITSKELSPSENKGGSRLIGVSRRRAIQSLPRITHEAWVPANKGAYVSFSVKSPGATGLRIALFFQHVPQSLRLRVGTQADWENGISAYSFDGSWIRQTYGSDGVIVWTPLTAGEEQVVELWIEDAYAIDSLGIGIDDVSHIFATEMFRLPDNKLLSCEQNYSCSTNADILNAGKAVARIVVTAGGKSELCSGALLNDRGSTGTPWFATANHCVSSAAGASSIQIDWFFEQPCNGAGTVAAYTSTFGSQIAFTDNSVDFTLLRLTGSVPSGVVFLGWDPTELAIGQAVYGVHHPAGIKKAYSTGSVALLVPSITSRDESGNTWTISATSVGWQVGATEQGSSGSPLMTNGGIFRGTLNSVPSANSCSGVLLGNYAQFSKIYPKIRQLIDPAQPIPDEPNSAAATYSAQLTDYTTVAIAAQLQSGTDEDWYRFNLPQHGVWRIWTSAPAGLADLDTVGQIFMSDGITYAGIQDDNSVAPGFHLAVTAGPGRYFIRVTGKGGVGAYILNSVFVADDDHSNFFELAESLAPNATVAGRIDYGGDNDVFAIDLATAGTLRISSSGSTDTVGLLYDKNYNLITFNDDAVPNVNLNFDLNASLAAGRYYLNVIGYDVGVTGAYSIKTTFTATSTAVANYTGYWWNAAEPGWGINFNHQGNGMFASMYTYASDGQPMWLAATSMTLQPDGSYAGALARFTGPPFYQAPWGSVNASQVGNLSVRFASSNSATITYSVNGVVVNKSVAPFVFGPSVICAPVTGSRATSANYQDLWWTPSEPGWGAAIGHQGSTIFAAIFTYNNTGRDGWFAATNLARQPDGSFTGDFALFSGPPFNSQPWGAVNAANVGTMTLRFSNGEAGTLTYSVLGTTVAKSISRFVFGDTLPVCH